MQLNDLWSIAFLVLLTNNPKFAYCYSYELGKKDPVYQITFRPELFRKLMYRMFSSFEEDKGLCYVISQLTGFDRFKDRGKNGINYSKSNSLSLKSIKKISMRDLYFYIWVLCQKKYPKEKILRYELGDVIEEIDYEDNIKSNYSILEIDLENQRARKTSFYNKNEINKSFTPKTKNSLNRRMQNLGITTTKTQSKIMAIPSYQYYDQKSMQEEKFVEERQEARKTPKQEIEGIPQYKFGKEYNEVNETKKTLDSDQYKAFQLSNSTKIKKKDLFKNQGINLDSINTISNKMGSKRSANTSKNQLNQSKIKKHNELIISNQKSKRIFIFYFVK